jgi:hypothetical protein
MFREGECVFRFLLLVAVLGCEKKNTISACVLPDCTGSRHMCLRIIGYY